MASRLKRRSILFGVASLLYLDFQAVIRWRYRKVEAFRLDGPGDHARVAEIKRRGARASDWLILSSISLLNFGVALIGWRSWTKRR